MREENESALLKMLVVLPVLNPIYDSAKRDRRIAPPVRPSSDETLLFWAITVPLQRLLLGETVCAGTADAECKIWKQCFNVHQQACAICSASLSAPQTGRFASAIGIPHAVQG